MAVSVWAALWASDGLGLKAVTPLAMASVPVRATEPAANARSRSRMLTLLTVSWIGATGNGPGGPPAPRNTMRTTPMATISSALPTNR